MKTIIYTCDRCRNVYKTNQDLTIIEVFLRKESWTHKVDRFQQEWCDKCCKEFKIELHRNPTPDPKDPISLESILKEFVLSTIESAKYGD